MSDAEAVKLWEEDKARERPSRDELDAMYQQYAEEGHFIITGHVNGDQPLDSWVAWCAVCKDTSYGEKGGIPIGGLPDLLSYEEAKWWGRGHRTDNGLAWQEWGPSVDIKAQGERLREDPEFDEDDPTFRRARVLFAVFQASTLSEIAEVVGWEGTVEKGTVVGLLDAAEEYLERFLDNLDIEDDD